MDKEVLMQFQVGHGRLLFIGHLYAVCSHCHPVTPDLWVTEYRGLNLKEGSWTVLTAEVTISLHKLFLQLVAR